MTFNEAFKRYLETIPANASKTQILEASRTFHAGALSALVAIKTGADDAEDLLGSIGMTCQTFIMYDEMRGAMGENPHNGRS